MRGFAGAMLMVIGVLIVSLGLYGCFNNNPDPEPTSPNSPDTTQPSTTPGSTTPEQTQPSHVQYPNDEGTLPDTGGVLKWH